MMSGQVKAEGQRKKKSKAEKLVRRQQKLVSSEESTENRVKSNEFPTLKTIVEAKAEKIQLVSSKESTKKPRQQLKAPTDPSDGH